MTEETQKIPAIEAKSPTKRAKTGNVKNKTLVNDNLGVSVSLSLVLMATETMDPATHTHTHTHSDKNTHVSHGEILAKIAVVG